MNNISCCSASIEAAVRRVLCYGGCSLVCHSRRVCRCLHLAPSTEKCSRTARYREVISSRSSQWSSWRRRATTVSVRHNGPDRCAVALQDFESEHGLCNPHGVSDCPAGGGGRAGKDVLRGADMSPLHRLAIHGHNVGDAYAQVEVVRAVAGDGSSLRIRRELGNVGRVLQIQNIVCYVDLQNRGWRGLCHTCLSECRCA